MADMFDERDVVINEPICSPGVEESALMPTRGLSRNQFIRAIEIREKQIKDDQARLSEWKSALKMADRFWKRNPEWTFGQCLDAIMKPAMNE